MRAMAEHLSEFGADFTDGITLFDKTGEVHIAPDENESAISLEMSPSENGVPDAGLKEKYEKMLKEMIDKKQG